jgi:hypothetical protein
MARIAVKELGTQQLTAVAATLYTVAANRRGIIRHIHFFNADVVARKVTVSLGVDAAATRIFDGFSIGPASGFDYYCFHVLNAADVIQGFADIAAKVTITAGGEEEILA